ncbi:hypothetical protein ABZU32_35845 [Sphaerisporangium sp. NPDC005288]|uniref:hypothetical protein n=1 Tax=Sphaerisporangium sp. NPDC005288 TaxID=3155114 RepID=UPI0033AB0699
MRAIAGWSGEGTSRPAVGWREEVAFMGDARADGSDRYWRIRTVLEFTKAGVWIVIQCIWNRGRFGPF